jgi:phospholipid/cholesterol/gamma-HCH transport system permease protein
MTAILVAGRSGAAFAAELGTMKVSEEVDALRTMGLSPQRFLVLPRVGALALAAPLLTILGNAMGILGGLAIGVGAMDISLQSYWTQTAASIDTSDVVTGLVKAVFFGVLVGLIACHRGLSTRGGAEGVGRSTTSAVVTTLFALIVADAVFTYLFTLYGL